MEKPVISILTPISNEEKCITTTLDSLVSQKTDVPYEIILCLNNSNDKTEQVVKNYIRHFDYSKHPALTKIELITSNPGKPNAVNKLFSYVDTNYLMFTDGDVIVDEFAMNNLYNALKIKPKAAIAAGEDHSFSEIGKKIISKPIFTVRGRLYMCNRENLSFEMLNKGFLEIPPRVCHEDDWLSLIAGYDKIIRVHEAWEYSLPYSGLIERIKMAKRYAAARFQIESEYPKLVLDYNSMQNQDLDGNNLKTRLHNYLNHLYFLIRIEDFNGVKEKLSNSILNMIISPLGFFLGAYEYYSGKLNQPGYWIFADNSKDFSKKPSGN